MLLRVLPSEAIRWADVTWGLLNPNQLCSPTVHCIFFYGCALPLEVIRSLHDHQKFLFTFLNNPCFLLFNDQVLRCAVYYYLYNDHRLRLGFVQKCGDVHRLSGQVKRRLRYNFISRPSDMTWTNSNSTFVFLLSYHVTMCTSSGFTLNYSLWCVFCVNVCSRNNGFIQWVNL